VNAKSVRLTAEVQTQNERKTMNTEEINGFELVSAWMKKTDEIEDGLKMLRDQVTLETKQAINRALGCVQTMRDGLWLVDKALEKEYGG
jgi:hypothetical protein